MRGKSVKVTLILDAICSFPFDYHKEGSLFEGFDGPISNLHRGVMYNIISGQGIFYFLFYFIFNHEWRDKFAIEIGKKSQKLMVVGNIEEQAPLTSHLHPHLHFNIHSVDVPHSYLNMAYMDDKYANPGNLEMQGNI